MSVVTLAQFKNTAVRLHLTSSVEVREIEAMLKTMRQMKSLSHIVAAHQVVLQAQQDLIVAHQAALQAQHDQAVLQAQHDQMLQQAVEAHENGDTDDEWLIAHGYENEEWADGV